MLKVLLVDDEAIILKGLALTYDWEGMGCQVVGMAASGEQALELIREEQPDVVLTDIQMNGMSGLELIERGKEIRKDLIFVMISAFKDFAYAQEACNRGAFSYLVKPIEEEKLAEVMKAAGKQFAEQSAAKQRYENWKKLLLDGGEDFQEILLQKYLKNMLSLEEFSEIMEMIGCRLLPTSCFSVVSADFDISYKVTEQLQYEMNRMELFQELKKELGKYYSLWGLYRQESLVFILRLEPGQDIRMISGIVEEVQRRTGHSIVSAVSPVCAGGLGLKQAYGQADHFLSIADAAGAVFLEPGAQPQGDQESAVYSEYAEQPVLNAIRGNRQEQIKEAYKSYISLLPSGRDENYQKACMLRLLSGVSLALENTYGMTEEIRNGIRILYENAGKLSAPKMVDVIYQMLLKIHEVRLECQPETLGSYFSGYVEKAQAYIEEKLSDPELSIGDVAKAVFLNPVYFGRMFKSAGGMSFKRYLLFRRIELAKKLLLDEYSISAVCEKVGIWNPSYFSQVFKQTVGCLPSEYRRQVKEEQTDEETCKES